MKTIRYRVWDGRRMRSMDEEDGPVLYRGDVYDDWRAFEDGTPNPEVVVMLSTGLADSEGREVFEGDVVEVVEQCEDDGEETWRGVVEMRPGYGPRMVSTSIGLTPGLLYAIQYGGTRVVGHIYQPEHTHLRTEPEDA